MSGVVLARGALCAGPGDVIEAALAESTPGVSPAEAISRGTGTVALTRKHVLTAIAVNIERLSTQEPDDSAYRPRPPTAFQQYLDAHELPSPRCGAKGSDQGKPRSPTESPSGARSNRPPEPPHEA
jgi:hypothetical protein